MAIVHFDPGVPDQQSLFSGKENQSEALVHSAEWTD